MLDKRLGIVEHGRGANASSQNEKRKYPVRNEQGREKQASNSNETCLDLNLGSRLTTVKMSRLQALFSHNTGQLPGW